MCDLTFYIIRGDSENECKRNSYKSIASPFVGWSAVVSCKETKEK